MLLFKVKSNFGELLYLSMFTAMISYRVDILYVRANNNHHCFSSLCDNVTHFCMILEYVLQTGHTVLHFLIFVNIRRIFLFLTDHKSDDNGV